jgi:CubicO group peptidase (beta-lactamase class C family)
MSQPFGRLRRLCDDAVAAGVVPGTVILFGDEGETRFHEAFGARQVDPVRLPATLDTIYDVASLTKAVVTSVIAMRAVGDGLLRLDDPVIRYVPEFVGEAKEGVTIRHLLAHAAGLPAHRPFYLQHPGTGREAAGDGEGDAARSARRAAILLAAAAEPLTAPPGTRAVYTDLGFMLLGWLLERVRGARLDALADREIFHPLALGATAFGPLAADAGRAIAATERCPWRGRLLVGEVHDQNAWAMNGVAGHAGLFSTAHDLAVIAHDLAAVWRGEEPTGGARVDRDVIREFWTPSGVPGSNWRLGWDGPAPHGSQAGALLARSAVGHLGFTGCSLWIDPERNRVIVFLSNRIHPVVRDDPRFRAFRPAVQDAAIEG